MSSKNNYSRRSFLSVGLLSTAGIGLIGWANAKENIYGNLQDSSTKRLPYKIGIRQASLRNPFDPKKNMVANFDTFKVARDIPDIIGVELQVASGNPNMQDFNVARRYKAEANKWGLDVPTTAVSYTHLTLPTIYSV